MTDFNFFQKRSLPSVQFPSRSNCQNAHRPISVPSTGSNHFDFSLPSKRATIYGTNHSSQTQPPQNNEYKHRSFQYPLTSHFLEDKRIVFKRDNQAALGINSHPSCLSPPTHETNLGRAATLNSIRILECKKRYLSSISPEPVQSIQKEERVVSPQPYYRQATETSPKSPIDDRLIRELSRRRENNIRSPTINIREDELFETNHFPNHEQTTPFDLDCYTIDSNSHYSQMSESTTDISLYSEDDMDSIFDLYDVTSSSFQFTNTNSMSSGYDFTPVGSLPVPSHIHLADIERQSQQLLSAVSIDDMFSEYCNDGIKENDDFGSISSLDTMDDQTHTEKFDFDHPQALQPLFSTNTVDRVDEINMPNI